VKLQDVCGFDEYSENEVALSATEFEAERSNLRPQGKGFGSEIQHATDMAIEVWISLDDKP